MTCREEEDKSCWSAWNKPYLKSIYGVEENASVHDEDGVMKMTERWNYTAGCSPKEKEVELSKSITCPRAHNMHKLPSLSTSK